MNATNEHTISSSSTYSTDTLDRDLFSSKLKHFLSLLAVRVSATVCAVSQWTTTNSIPQPNILRMAVNVEYVELGRRSCQYLQLWFCFSSCSDIITNNCQLNCRARLSYHIFCIVTFIFDSPGQIGSHTFATQKIKWQQKLYCYYYQ